MLRIATVGVNRQLTVRIGNGGANPAPAGTPVRFYDGDPRTGGVLLGSAATSLYLAAGAFEDVSVLVPDQPTAQTIWIVADDAGGLASTLHESDEANNFFDSGTAL